MDHTAHDQSLKLRPYKDADSEKVVEPEKLLEEFWFFGNLLIDTKSKSRRMSRSLSDPCTSYDETNESIEKITGQGKESCMERKDQNPSRTKGRKSKRSTSKNLLLRAPSLPITTLETEEFEDEETEYSMGKLIRQASLNSSMPQRTNTTACKGLTKSCSNISRHRSTRPRQLKTEKNLLSDHVDCCEALQGNFKDMGFDEKNLNPGLQENERFEEDEEKNRVWAAPPGPRWGGKRSADEMKAQIKFWARAVASNVRQEC